MSSSGTGEAFVVEESRLGKIRNTNFQIQVKKLYAEITIYLLRGVSRIYGHHIFDILQAKTSLKYYSLPKIEGEERVGLNCLKCHTGNWKVPGLNLEIGKFPV